MLTFSIIILFQGIVSELKTRWNNLEPSEKIFGTILILNSLVFLAWQVPRWQHVMVKYFTTDALASKFVNFKIISTLGLLL